MPNDQPGDGRTPGVDVGRANAARMYDYMLGGAHNLEVDREQVRALLASNPDAPAAARANRAFLFRVVTWCLEHGIGQFLDLGSGVPTVGNVHEIAHRRNTGARIAYVDLEPVAVAHARELLVDTPLATVTRADLRDHEAVLTAPGVAGLLDFTRPVALLAVAVLHFVPGDAAPVIAAYRGALTTGSVAAISHVSTELREPAQSTQSEDRASTGERAYRTSATPLTLRAPTQIRELLTGFDLLDPGLVDVTDWPDPTPDTPTADIHGCLAVLP